MNTISQAELRSLLTSDEARGIEAVRAELLGYQRDFDAFNSEAIELNLAYEAALAGRVEAAKRVSALKRALEILEGGAG